MRDQGIIQHALAERLGLSDATVVYRYWRLLASRPGPPSGELPQPGPADVNSPVRCVRDPKFCVSTQYTLSLDVTPC